MKLIDEAKMHNAEPPSPRTLRIYGLREHDWLRILKRQGWKCAICGVSGKVLWNIDHDHLPRYSKLPDEDRARHVRGILCFRCNKYNAPSRNFTANLARNLASYIRKYEKRRDKNAQRK